MGKHKRGEICVQTSAGALEKGTPQCYRPVSPGEGWDSRSLVPMVQELTVAPRGSCRSVGLLSLSTAGPERSRVPPGSAGPWPCPSIAQQHGHRSSQGHSRCSCCRLLLMALCKLHPAPAICCAHCAGGAGERLAFGINKAEG